MFSVICYRALAVNDPVVFDWRSAWVLVFALKPTGGLGLTPLIQLSAISLVVGF
jgi:hypothetical protein